MAVTYNETPRYGLAVQDDGLLTLSLAGPAGPTGPSGPNTITGSTTTSLTGYLYGNGSSVTGVNLPITIPTVSGGTITNKDGNTVATFGTGAPFYDNWTFSGGVTVTGTLNSSTSLLANSISATSISASGEVSAAVVKVGNNILQEAGDFTLSEASHAGRYVRLTKTGSTQTITLPTTGVSTGAEFQFYRATSQTLAFSGGTVNGGTNLASVPQNGAFALKYLGSGTYDFI